MSEEVLNAVDAVAGKRGRSRFLEEAAREKLERLELAEAIEATAGIARGQSYRHWRDRGTTATWVRKTRRTESPA
jgi:metal-responsive CopG/Arc/MetJ family transcriptional regulator